MKTFKAFVELVCLTIAWVSMQAVAITIRLAMWILLMVLLLVNMPLGAVVDRIEFLHHSHSKRDTNS